MASLNMFLAPLSSSNTTTTNNITSIPTSISTRRARSVQTFATAAKGSGGSSEEKGFLDWLSIALQKDSFVETDPILQKVEGKSGTVVTSKKTTGSAAAAPKKSGGNGSGFGGLGGLFAKK